MALVKHTPGKITIIQRNIDELRERKRELRALIYASCPVAVILTEAKAISVSTLHETSKGASRKKVPPVLRGWGSAPRAGLSIALLPGVHYAVSHAYNERKGTTNGIIQAVNIRCSDRTSLTGAFLSPNMFRAVFSNFLTSIITTGTGRDWVLRDLYDGDKH